MSVTHRICPYTLKPLANIKNVNTEHIFADALGGTGDYTVKVDALANSRLGTSIDAAFINSSLISPLRTRIGIKPDRARRSGSYEGRRKQPKGMLRL